MTRGPLFDWANGPALRDQGMAIAAHAQERDAPGWSGRAYAAIMIVARSQPTVHVDDVLKIFTEHPSHFNAWGSVWQRAIKDGILARSGQFRQTRHGKKHSHQYPVYLSLIYIPPPQANAA